MEWTENEGIMILLLAEMFLIRGGSTHPAGCVTWRGTRRAMATKRPVIDTKTCLCVSIPVCVCNISWNQRANVDMEVLALPLQVSPVLAPASSLPSAGSSRLRSLVLS